MKKEIFIKQANGTVKMVKENMTSGMKAFSNEVKSYWDKKGKHFFTSWLKNLINDKIFGVTVLIELAVLIFIFIYGVSDIQFRDVVILHIPTFLCLTVSILAFYVSNTKGYKKLARFFEKN